MAHKVWTFRLEDGNHTLELDHDAATGDRILRLDAHVLEQTTGLDPAWARLGSKHRFEAGGHAGLATIRMSGAEYEYLLEVDGRLVPEGASVVIAEPLARAGTPAPGDAAMATLDGAASEAIRAHALMEKEIRSSAHWQLGLGAVHLIAAGYLSAAWGVILLLSGAASLVFVDAAMFVVYGITTAWVALANMSSGNTGWMGFALLQAYAAFRVFQQFGRYRQGQARYTALVAAGTIKDATEGRAGRVFPWLGCATGVLAFGGCWALFVVLLLVAGGTLPTALVRLGDVVFGVGVLGFAVSLASLLSGFRHRILALVGSMASGIVVLTAVAALILA